MAIVLVLALLMGSATASPGIEQRAARITLAMNANSALADPFSRWMNETCDMVIVDINYARWPEGESLWMALDMGVKRAFDLRLTQTGGRITAESSMLSAPMGVSDVSAWAEELLALARGALTMPQSGREIAYSGEDLARALFPIGITLRAASATARGTLCAPCENCGECEACTLCDSTQAAAMLIDTFAVCFEEVVDENVLIVRIAPREGEPPKITPDEAETADIALARLTNGAIREVCRAIAENPVG